jgi:hypothetical protein
MAALPSLQKPKALIQHRYQAPQLQAPFQVNLAPPLVPVKALVSRREPTEHRELRVPRLEASAPPVQEWAELRLRAMSVLQQDRTDLAAGSSSEDCHYQASRDSWWRLSPPSPRLEV